LYVAGIQKAAKLRNEDLNKDIYVGQLVHIKCRSRFTNPNYVSSVTQSSTPKSHVLRSGESFKFMNCCLFCATGDPYDGRRAQHKLVPVRSLEIQKSIISYCDKYNSDWSDAVRGRISSVHDLPAADAQYHNVCSVNFRTGYNIPAIFSSGDRKRKRMTGESTVVRLMPLREKHFLKLQSLYKITNMN